jgi:small-conductance mechanosensitive channel
VKAVAEPVPDEERLQESLPELGEDMRRRAGEVSQRLDGYVSLDGFNDLDGEWAGRAARLATERKALTERARALDAELGRLAEMREIWERSRALARESAAPPALLTRIKSILGSIEAARKTVQARRGSVLTLQNDVAGLEAVVSDVQDQLRAARSQERERLFVRDSPPLWAALEQRVPEGAFTERLRGSVQAQVVTLVSFAEGRGGIFAVHLAIFAATLILAAAFRRKARHWAREDESFEASARILGRPASASLVVALLATPFLYPNAPSVVTDLAVLIVVIPILRLLPGRLFTGMRSALFALVALYVVDRLRDLFESLPLLERGLLTIEALAGAGCLVWLLRSAEPSQANGWTRALALSFRVGLVLFAASFLTNLMGNVNLARLVLVGTLGSFLIAVILYTAAQILDGVVAVGLRTRFARRLGMVRNHAPLLRRRGFVLVHTALVAWWGWIVLGLFALRETAVVGVSSVVDAAVPLGAVEIAVGDILLFGLTIWGTFLFSRLLRFVLDEDVTPRLSLPRGVPYAVSYVLHYAILLLGFLLATAAAGFDLTSFALLAGALGVGIGFGLQNVVNNFISGLILLFERPVQVGDTIQVGDLFGEVRRIGIRSSTVRTWQGAEVIVPNGNLISEQVVNWTLSDRERRVEVRVGVAYGTDPTRVLALLLEVAAKHPDLLQRPEPTALFLGFGDSSLDFELRAWTGNSGEWMRIRSEITVAINAAIVEAGIEIPFPQRDLHLKSVKPELASLVSGDAAGAGRARDPDSR